MRRSIRAVSEEIRQIECRLDCIISFITPQPRASLPIIRSPAGRCWPVREARRIPIRRAADRGLLLSRERSLVRMSYQRDPGAWELEGAAFSLTCGRLAVLFCMQVLVQKLNRHGTFADRGGYSLD